MAKNLANGKACCILDLPCCIPPPNSGLTQSGARKMAVAGIFMKLCSTLSENDAIAIAEGLLAEFDLVPAGVGSAIAKGYARWMKQGVTQTKAPGDI